MLKNFLNHSKFFVLLTFIVFVSFAYVNTAKALTLTPPRLEYSGDPGSFVKMTMTLINESNTPETYYSSFANFEASGDTGVPSFVTPTDDLGTWMKTLPSITLSAGESKDVEVDILIPKDATPGGHFASVFWGTQPKNVGGKQVSVGAKTGSLVLLHVNGNVSENAALSQFDTLNGVHYFNALPINFYYLFQNSGGDRIEPTGNLIIKNMIGLTSVIFDGNPVQGNILPNSTRKINLVWSGVDGSQGILPADFFGAVSYEWHNFAFGYYHATLDLIYGTKNFETNGQVGFWVFPWQLILVEVLSVGLVLLVIIMFIRHYNKWVINRAEKMFEEHEAQMKHIEKKTIMHKVVGPKKHKK